MNIINVKELVHRYSSFNENNEKQYTTAVDGVSLNIKKGDFVAILGANGSGKSTLARHLNALLFPTEGEVKVGDYDTKDFNHLYDIRKTVGMVFQNPDNQIVGSIVEEDVGFGPENMALPTETILERVDEGLKSVGMTEFRDRSPARLSGGQKQRVAIAGVIAMHPQCIVLDEATAMLDPIGRAEVMETVTRLNKENKMTVILITHYMEEVVNADRIYVMNKGHLVMEGTPVEIFANSHKLRELKLDLPPAAIIKDKLIKAGVNINPAILTKEDLCREIVTNYDKKHVIKGVDDCEKPEEDKGEEILKLENLTFSYEKKTAKNTTVVNTLKNINLTVNKGEFIGLIGHTGSGKSTLIRHLNGLEKADSGNLYFKGQSIYEKGYSLRGLRNSVGLVFQYPEHQLFEETVIKDVMFGPLNQGLNKEEAEKRAAEALESVGIDEKYYEKSPFQLSGGQKRRVAIAGVLAMKPEVLILDEPAAGLDPIGKKKLLDLIGKLNKENKLTIILVSHSMEDVAEYVSRVVVMSEGEIFEEGNVRDVFNDHDGLEKIGLKAPVSSYLMYELYNAGFPVDKKAVTVNEAVTSICNVLNVTGGRTDA